MSKVSTAKQPKFFKPVFAAMLSALIILMTFTGIGYIPINPALKLTFNVLPVAVGAVLLGPLYGSILGLVFGLSSFFTCFGMDPFGNIMLGINPFLLFVVCVVPRVLCGLLPALIFKAFPKTNVGEIVGSAICCMLTAVFNTIGFLSLMWIFFANEFITNAEVIKQVGGAVIDNIITLFVLFAGVNALIEAGINLVLGSAICKALFKLVKKYS